MMAAPELRKGWCPGALRPMQSGDGLLLRMRPRLGTVRLSALATIAEAAARFGSGAIDLTNRGNLQLRGLTPESYPHALALLRDAGLIDADARIEAVRNILVDPLAGIDPARIDVRPFARQLEVALRDNEAFWQLPGKFGFSFSGTAQPRVDGHSADIMVAAMTPDSVAIALDGDDRHGARCTASSLMAVFSGLTAMFLKLRAGNADLRRMRDAVASVGGEEIYAAVGLRRTPREDQSPAIRERPPVGLLGKHDDIYAAGVGLPFGRIDPAQIEALRASAARHGIRAVRMSPRRAFVFAVNDEAVARSLLSQAQSCNLIVERGDPRLDFDVCPGSPGCVNATTDTRRDAQRIAAALRPGDPPMPLHVSGCEKGCARRGAAALTLVARNGLYDIIPGDGPSGTAALTGVAPAEIDTAVSRFIAEHGS